jgi:chromosome segregation ATPase
MSLWQRFEAWRAIRRSRLALGKAKELESVLVDEVRRLENDATETDRRHAEAIRELQNEMMRQREQYEHKVDRLERQIELARMENELLTGVHTRDVARLAAEAAVSERIATGQPVQQTVSF